MPNTIFAPDTTFPDLTGPGTTEQKLAAVQDYLFLLLESLRWTLRNLSPANFNETELIDWLNLQDIRAKTVVTDSLIADELYADFGAVADLTVDELRTDYAKAGRYLLGSTAPLDWIYIHGEQIDFLSGTVAFENGEALTEQLHHRDRCFWWTDASQSRMTSLKETDWPVTVYQYNVLTKGSFRFESVTRNGVTTKIPTLILGAGVGDAEDPDLGRGFLRKNTDSLALWLHGAEDQGLFIGDYTDIVGLRRTTEIDFSGWDGGTFTETVDGGVTHSFAVDFDQGGRPVKITAADGHETAVVWE